MGAGGGVNGERHAARIGDWRRGADAPCVQRETTGLLWRSYLGNRPTQSATSISHDAGRSAPDPTPRASRGAPPLAVAAAATGGTVAVCS